MNENIQFQLDYKKLIDWYQSELKKGNLPSKKEYIEKMFEFSNLGMPVISTKPAEETQQVLEQKSNPRMFNPTETPSIRNKNISDSVYLGGTINSPWRDNIIPYLTIPYIDPRVKNWDKEAIRRDKIKKKNSSIHLYVIDAGRHRGVYTFKEITESVITNPKGTIVILVDNYQLPKDSTIDKLKVDSIYEMLSSLEDDYPSYHCIHIANASTVNFIEIVTSSIDMAIERLHENEVTYRENSAPKETTVTYRTIPKNSKNVMGNSSSRTLFDELFGDESLNQIFTEFFGPGITYHEKDK